MTARISPLVLGFATGIALVGLGASALLTFVFGDVSTDAGSPWLTFVYAVFACAVLATVGGAALAGVLALSRPLLIDWPRRWSGFGGAILGALAAISAGIGILPALTRGIAPLGGRASWVISAALAGVAAALIVIALSGAARLARRIRDG